MNKGTKIISGFPGIGKTSVFKNGFRNLSVLDSDSSKFSWIYHDDGTKERNANFIDDYLTHIKSNIGKVDIIFVSSHEPVRDALTKENLKWIAVYPSKKRKEEFINLYKERGNSEDFIALVSKNWETWIDDLFNSSANMRVCIPFAGRFLNVALESIFNDNYHFNLDNYYRS